MPRYRMNRAVGIMNKGDEFYSDVDDPVAVSLVGAGYADLTLEDDDGDQVRREPDNDPDRAVKIGFEIQPDHGEHDSAGGPENSAS